MRRLKHPHIVEVADDFWKHGELIIVMDLALHGDLHDHVEHELKMCLATNSVFPGLGRSEFASRHVVRQLLDAIGHMHERGVIHRDLKLENVLVMSSRPASWRAANGVDTHSTELLDVKIADFGLSKYMGDKPVLARCRSQVGSPGFVAPEVLHTDSYDERVDYWSLGVMLYVVLCGQLPFTASKRQDIIEWHAAAVTGGITNCEAWKRASIDARKLVTGLLDTDPEMRFGLEGCLASAWLVEDDDEMVPAQPQAAITALSGHTGDALDSVELLLRDGQRQKCGNAGGTAQHEIGLLPDELILGVAHEDNGSYLGSSLTAFTSKGHVIMLQGSWAQPRHIFLAPAGHEVVDLHFEGGELFRLDTAAVAPNGAGSVACVGGRVGDAVDKVELTMRDGSVRQHGDRGGKRCGPWALQRGEFIVAAEHTTHPQGFLGSSIAFYTSQGRVLTLEGAAAPRTQRFAVPAGRQMCGLGFEDSRLASVATCPQNGDLSATIQHAVA